MGPLIGTKTSKEDYIKILLKSISEDASRHKRATDDKEYLIRDLEIIQERSKKLRKVIDSDKDFYYI